MTVRGQGDRWLAGEALDGVRFEHRAPVVVVDGPNAGSHGTVALLMMLGDDPLYLVTLSNGAGDARVRQSRLARAEER